MWARMFVFWGRLVWIILFRFCLAPSNILTHLIEWFGVLNMHSTDWNHIFRQWEWNIKRGIGINKSNGCLLLQFGYRREIRTEFPPLNVINLRIEHKCAMADRRKVELSKQTSSKTTHTLSHSKLTSIRWHEQGNWKSAAICSYRHRNANSNVEHMHNIDVRRRSNSAMMDVRMRWSTPTAAHRIYA